MKQYFLRFIKWSGIIILAAVLGLQFFQPETTNPLTNKALALEEHTQLPSEVNAILRRACQDCHSNKTDWPWYSHLAPVSFFVANHVKTGRRFMNFSEWGMYDNARSRYLLQEIDQWVTGGLMPLQSYILLHHNAKLSNEDIQAIVEWTIAERKRLYSNKSQTTNYNQ